MSVIDKIRAKAAADVKHVVLAEGTEPRTVQAAAKIVKLGLAKITLVGPKAEIEAKAAELGLRAGKKTRTGWSTDAETLEKLKKEHDIIPAILEWRKVSKLKSTYVEGLTKTIDPDGRIRTTFHQTVTATGRLSSTEPNLQNIPTRTELGSQLRRMFTAAGPRKRKKGEGTDGLFPPSFSWCVTD